MSEVKENIQEVIEQDIEQDVEQDIKQDIEQNIEESIEQDIEVDNQYQEQIEENEQRQEQLIENEQLEAQEPLKPNDQLQEILETDIEEQSYTNTIEEGITENKNKKKIIIIVLAIILTIGIISGIILLIKKEPEEIVSNLITMPSLINLTREEAEQKIEGTELEITYQDTYKEGAEKGKIVYQSISPDTEIEKGSKIVVFINNLEKDELKNVIMPSVIGLNIDEAMEQLLQLGLEVEKIEEINESVIKGIVFEQDVEENAEIEMGSKVTLKVSLGTLQENTETDSNSSNNQQNTVQTNNNATQNNNNSTSQTNNSSSGSSTGTNNTWSDWMETLPSGINTSNSEIETKTQYSYRTKETTTSTATTLSGWTQDGVASTSYSSWGSSLITSEKPVESDTLKIISTTPYTTKEYTYYHWEMKVTMLATGESSRKYDIVKLSSTDVYEVLSATKHTIVSEKEYGNFPDGYTFAPAGAKSGDKCSQCGAHFWALESSKTVQKYSYTYQQREKITTYNYYKWSDWSAYSDTVATSSSSKEVRTRTLSRYKAK